jgi:dipeptidyl aminopeptidase/acylaminoacyl peptidase
MTKTATLTVMAFFIGLLAVSCATAPRHPALQQADLPELIPVRKFFLSRTPSKYKVSPDGQRLAWLAPKNFRRTIFIKSIDGDDTTIIDTHSRRSVYGHRWLQDNRRLLYLQDQEGNENHHIYLVDSLHPTKRPVDLTPFENTRAGIQQIIRSDPDHILIVDNRRDKTVFDLYRVNLNTRLHTLVAQNPGDVTGWITDLKGDLRARVRKVHDDIMILELFDAKGQSWHPLIDWEMDDSIQFLGFTADDHGMWLLSSRGRDRTSLVRLDLRTGAETVVYQEPKVDVRGVYVSELTRQPVWAVSCPDYPKIHFFDSDFEVVFESVLNHKPAGLSLISVDNGERLFTVSLYTDRGIDYYLVDSETGEKRLLDQNPIVRYASELSPVQPVAFKSRDGLDLHGYLTLPQGTPAQSLPTVLLVHGGPWGRDYWGYDGIVQFLANRGYAVLQVNYRGSRGYGRRFMEAAIGEFAAKMHADLIDAVQWAVRKGIADPRRIAIAGGSYGGYAALVGLSYTPETFACGVDVFGVSDLVSLLDSFPEYWKPWMPFWHKYVGDPHDPADRRTMIAKSPLFRVDQISQPLLIVHGANDVRARQQQSDQMVAAMRQAGKEVEYIVFQHEGHGITHWKTVLVFTRRLEDFLAKHLGGRSNGFDYYEVGLAIF